MSKISADFRNLNLRENPVQDPMRLQAFPTNRQITFPNSGIRDNLSITRLEE